MSFDLFAAQAPVQLNPDSTLLKNNEILRGSLEKKFGKEKMHTVLRVIDLPEGEETKANNGHPQKIVLHISGKECVTNGAYFKRYTPKKTPLHIQEYEEMCKKK